MWMPVARGPAPVELKRGGITPSTKVPAAAAATGATGRWTVEDRAMLRPIGGTRCSCLRHGQSARGSAPLVLSTPPAGIALATAAFLVAASLGDQALLGWAWRLTFLVSAVLFLLAIFIRRNLEETPEYRAAVEDAGQGRT